MTYKVLYTGGDRCYVVEYAGQYYLMNLDLEGPPLQYEFVDAILKFGYFDPVVGELSAKDHADVAKKLAAAQGGKQMKTQEELALKMAKEMDSNFAVVTRLHDWKGYAVYLPDLAPDSMDDYIVGLPYIILAKGDKLRWSTDEELFEHRAAFPEDYEDEDECDDEDEDRREQRS